MFGALKAQGTDPLFALMGLHREDPRPSKLDLGIGVYRNDAGVTPIMRSVKAAEWRLGYEQTSKSYLGAEGDARFTQLLTPIVFGATAPSRDRLAGLQTPGGTGALRLAAELLVRTGRVGALWTGTPGYPNHLPIFRDAGLTVRTHPYYDQARGRIDFDGMMTSLEEAVAGDVLLVHGSCHNPTGTSFSMEQWAELAALCVRKGVLPFIDIAYQGLGDGLEADVKGMQSMLAVVPEALISYSCNKNFGLYRDRVGALWVMSSSARESEAVRDNMQLLARSIWSMPPDHGAAIVRIILEDEGLRQEWRIELETMRQRVMTLRGMLAAAHPSLTQIGEQRGMFALLPISKEAVAQLRGEHGIYMVDSGRINVAGLRVEVMETFIASLLPFLAG
jgi:aromatic-amino-acid transaminase